MAHSDDATKKIEKAIPTTNADGKVVKWDIEYSYTKEDYSSSYNSEIYQTEEGDEKFTLQKPGAFKKKDLVALLPIESWNNIFNSQYESTHSESSAVETTDSDFDVDSLAD